MYEGTRFVCTMRVETKFEDCSCTNLSVRSGNKVCFSSGVFLFIRCVKEGQGAKFDLSGGDLRFRIINLPLLRLR